MGIVLRFAAFVIPLAVLVPPDIARAGTIPTHGNYLTSLGAESFGFIADGSSNTILLTETTRFAICFDQVGLPVSSITDGTSNTILFGENTSLTVRPGSVLPRQPIGSIVDGTSNTILIGETPIGALCFGDTQIIDPIEGIPDGTSNTIRFDENSRFDICLSNVRVGTIADGTSNTIQFGEVTTSPVCFNEVRVVEDATVAVSEPATLGILGLAFIGLWFARRRQNI